MTAFGWSYPVRKILLGKDYITALYVTTLPNSYPVRKTLLGRDYITAQTPGRKKVNAFAYACACAVRTCMNLRYEIGQLAIVERERERERETHTHTHTHTHTQRQTHRDRDGETDRDTDRQTETDRDRVPDRRNTYGNRCHNHSAAKCRDKVHICSCKGRHSSEKLCFCGIKSGGVGRLCSDKISFGATKLPLMFTALKNSQ